jgi:hypothetical protein
VSRTWSFLATSLTPTSLQVPVASLR